MFIISFSYKVSINTMLENSINIQTFFKKEFDD